MRFLTIKNEDAYYVGPLEPAKSLARDDADDPLLEAWFVSTGAGSVGAYRVETEHDWGQGASTEEAWRFYLGAVFGPEDEYYDEEHLEILLIQHGMDD